MTFLIYLHLPAFVPAWLNKEKTIRLECSRDRRKKTTVLWIAFPVVFLFCAEIG